MIAWAYCRFSSDNQREESIDAQARAIKEYCQREGYTLERIYKDEARSATSDNRPEFQQMFQDIKNFPCDFIIVHKLDRFSRDRYDSAFYKHKLKENDIRLLSVLENIDGSPESIILESVLEGMAEYYSRNLSRETKKGLRENAYQCRHTGGLPPLGYDIDEEGHYQINTLEANWVKTIYRMKSEGRSYMEIAAYLNSIGATTKRGGDFNKNSFHDLLRNEKYKGVFVFNKTADPVNGKRNNHAHKPDEEIIRIPDGIPKIVDASLWNQVNASMNDKKQNARNKSKRLYLLSGLIYCGQCGGGMSGNTRRSGPKKILYSTYECNKRKREKICNGKGINRDVVESIVIDYLQNFFFTKDNLRNISKQIYDYQLRRSTKTPPELKALKKELKQTETELNNIVDAIAASGAQDWMIEKGNKLNDKITYLKGKISYMEKSSIAPVLSEEQIYAYLAKDADIKSLDLAGQRAVIKAYVDRVIVYEHNIEIQLIINKNNPDGNNDCRDCGFDGDPTGNRTRVTAVKGRCLNRLTIGPK